MQTHYRPEIDGLRALAVLPVILFHAGIPGFRGGFVGVDVFFVISGYLITSILLTELAQGRFSLVAFYERRARRILPALVFVIAVCLPFAWMWMTPDQLRDFSRSIVAVTLFASNVLFWLESGYFAPIAETKPLLHTWSLSVEEQFYVVFPLLLAALWRFGSARAALIVGALAGASFAIAQLGGNWPTADNPANSFRWMAVPDHAFYLTPARAWELLIGALVAFFLHERCRSGLRFRETGAAMGLVMIVYAVLRFDESTPFPSAYTLFPTVGTALIIVCASAGTGVGRLLSAKVLVGVGLISYSAYLWHQPLFAFARLRSLAEPGTAVLLTLAAASLVLAYLSWRYVEQPFRNRQTMDRRRVYTLAACASVVMLSLGLTGHFARGFDERFTPELAQLRPPHPANTSTCNNVMTVLRSAPVLCRLGADHTPPRIAVLGDSHAASLTDALERSGVAHDFSFIPVNDNWCAPLHGFGTSEPTRNPRCRRLMSDAIDRISRMEDIDTVLLVAEWANYTKGRRWHVNNVAVYSDGTPAPDLATDEELREHNTAAFSRALAATVARLGNRRVIIVKSVPEYETRVPETLAKAAIFGDGQLPVELRVTKADYRRRNREVEAVWAEAAEAGVIFVNTDELFCADTASWCRYTSSEGASLYEDDNHLSFHGAVELSGLILPRLVQPDDRRAGIGTQLL